MLGIFRYRGRYILNQGEIIFVKYVQVFDYGVYIDEVGDKIVRIINYQVLFRKDCIRLVEDLCLVVKDFEIVFWCRQIMEDKDLCDWY